MPALADAVADLRFGLRQMARRPALYGLALLSLALALGATTALFSVAAALFFREAPGIRQPSTLVEVYTHEPGGYWSSFSSADFRGFHEHEEIFSSLAAKLPLSVSFSTGAIRRDSVDSWFPATISLCWGLDRSSGACAPSCWPP